MRVGLFFGSFDPPHIGHVNVVMGAINSNQVDRDRDSAMTNVSSEDIAFIRSKSKWDSGTAENILRRHTMKYLNPSFYGQQ
jgi:nicotinic acid mononucleotide adenylyltransferase